MYLLNLHNFNSKFYFVNNSYFYLQLLFNTNNILNTSNYEVSISDELLLYNQQYVDSSIFNVGIGEDYTNIVECNGVKVYTKNYSNISAKIMLSNIPGNYDIISSNIINDNSFIINYDHVMDNIDQVIIQILDPNFRILELNNCFSFTINIHEVVDVLKETLINTKTNNVNSTGNFI